MIPLLVASLFTSSLLPHVSVAVAGQSLDTASTVIAFRRGCVEGNRSLYGSQPSVKRLVVTKSAVSVSLIAGVWVLHKSGHPTAAKRVALVTGGISGAVGVRNLLVACR